MENIKQELSFRDTELREIENQGYELVEVLKPGKVFRCIRKRDGLQCTLSKKPTAQIDAQFLEVRRAYDENKDKFSKLYIPNYHGTVGSFAVFDYIPGTIFPWSEVDSSPYFGGGTISTNNVSDIVTLSQELDVIGVFTDFHWGNFIFMDDGRIGIIDWEHVIPCRRSSPRLAYLYCLMFKNKAWQHAMIEEAKKRSLIDYTRFKEDIRYRATLFCKLWVKHHAIRREQEKILTDIQSEFLYNAQWNGVDLDRLLERCKYQVFEDLGQTQTLKSQIDCQGKFDCLGIDRYDLNGKRLLDIGCNSGWFLKEYARRGASPVIGIDIEAEWCDLAENLLKKVYMLQNVAIHKAEFYDYTDKDLDFIVASSVLHYFENKKRFFEHARDLLSSNGVLIVEVPVTEDGSDMQILDMKPKRYIAGRNYLERVAAESGFRLDFFGRSNLRERRVFHFQRH